MSTPTEIMERLKALPTALAATERRFWVEAVSDETKEPMIDFYAQKEAADAAAQEWAKGVGADGFYPPRGGHPRAFSFKTANAPTSKAWVNAGRGYVERHGYVAKALSKRPEGKALAAQVAALPAFPEYKIATAHLGRITDLRTANGSSGVGYSDGKIHFTVPFAVAGRYFIDAVNHNYDILKAAQSAAKYVGTDRAEWAPSLDYKDDPISWRPSAGWAFITRAEVEFLIAEENLRRAKARAVAA